MTDMVHVRKGSSNQISLAEIQERLDAKAEIVATREASGGGSTIKARVAAATRSIQTDSLDVLVKIQNAATALANVFDGTIKPGPLTQEQINQISDEYLQFENIKILLTALEPRFRELIFAHLDATGPRIPGRPASHTPGKVEATVDGAHYIFERRGGNREDPTMSEDIKDVLPVEVAAQVFVTVLHPAVPAWEEEQFDEEAFGRLVAAGKIDLDLIAPYLTPGKRRTPTFNKTLVDGDR